jgi:hypothetical protein
MPLAKPSSRWEDNIKMKLTDRLNQWGRVLAENLIVVHLAKKFPPFP